MARELVLFSRDDSFVEVITQLTKSKRSVVTFSDSSKILEKYGKKAFDTLVMQVKSNFEECLELSRAIRAKEESEKTALIMVSEKFSDQEKMQAYTEGLDDCVVLMGYNEAFFARLESINSLRKHFSKYKVKYKSASEKTLHIMDELGELSEVLDFLGKSFSCGQFEDIALCLFSTLEGMELKCTVAMRGDDKTPVHFRDDGVMTPLEADIFSISEKKGRIIDFSNKTLFNYDHFSMLVRNMPVENSIRYGRLRDTLAILASGANSCVQSIINMNVIANKNRATSELITAITGEMQKLSEDTQSQSESVMRIADEFTADLEFSFGSLGLNDEQEKFYINLVEQTTKKIIDASNQDARLHDYFDTIIGKLREIH